MGYDVGSERPARLGEGAMSDTSVDVEERFLKLMLARSPAERLAMACRMFSTAKALVRAGILEEHGLIDPYELREHMFLRLYGQDFGETEKAKILNSWKAT